MNKTLSVPESKIALISLLVFLIICAVIIFIITFFLIRNNKVKKIKKQANEIYKFISSKTTNGSMTISRFKSISQAQGDYKKDLSELININEQIRAIYKPLFALCNKIKNDKNKKYHTLKNESLRLNNLFDEYKNLWDKFSKKSETLNVHWGIVDSISSKLSTILLELENYISKNKNNLGHTYDLLVRELDELQKNNFAFEDKKLNNEITNVSAEINEYEKRVYSFCKKVDVLVKLENSIFYALPQMFNNKHFDSKFSNEIMQLKNNLQRLQHNFVSMPYQELLKETKLIYLRYFTLLKENKNNNEFKSFIKNKFKTLEDEIQKNNSLVNLFIQKIDEDNSYKSTIKQEYMSTIIFWENLVKDFEILKEKADKGIEIGLLELQTFLEQYCSLLQSFNSIISQYDYFTGKKVYDKLYIEINNQWCLKVLNHRDVLEKLSENDELFKQLIRLNKEINNDFITKNYIDLSSELWIKWTELLIKLYKKIYTQYIYKAMIDALTKKLAQKNINNSPEMEEYMLYVDRNIVSLRFKEAFEFLAAASKGK
ncbi:hypothetical protein NQV05_00690 [Mycoplasmopsis agalactiae]|uniref:hypothetical protein n=1 Tax=Mycoplasmopsis agalactiae TaxID=2110 RepID=UPI00211BDEE5|nr:hypothetical protein [Mycoplasmopsis agalactiae]UUM25660.1 hypothetical protein NQV05_00690 [Mycoplasmopsis agalactiae]